MSAEHVTVLAGCAPVPLAHYLKALGILRLVGEQADPGARGRWSGETFYLHSTLDGEDLVAFLLDRYRPTPILAPWNGGSGFGPKDNAVAIEAIATSPCARFDGYRQAIATARDLRLQLGITEKLEKDQKEQLLLACRNQLADEVLPWLDAAFLLTADGAKFPPLLGTGGNDGRLDFTNNFMQRLGEVMDPRTGEALPEAAAWLRGALFDETLDRLQKGSAIGQFLPGAAGGANSTAGFAADPLINPWDFILMLEGTLVFAVAGVKRLESSRPGVLSYPFAVRQAGVGYASAASRDEADARAEMWLPMWSQAAGPLEVKALFAEGRAQVGQRPARHGVDFARAVASLGTDRGLKSFQRYGFQVRNGLAYFAIPLSRVKAVRQPQVDLLAEIDGWLDSFRGKALADTAPAAAGRALHQLEQAILALCQDQGARRVQEVLTALGTCEAVMARSLKWTHGSFLEPIPLLGAGWLAATEDGTVEGRLAMAIASQSFLRAHVEPVRLTSDEGRMRAFFLKNASEDIVWSARDLPRDLVAVLDRRGVLNAREGNPALLPGRIPAALGDVAAFLEGQVDLTRLADLLAGYLLLDWSAIPFQPHARGPAEPLPSAAHALTRLCHLPHEFRSARIPWVPGISRHLARGDVARATQLAAQRLRASGLAPAIRVAQAGVSQGLRLAAALLTPLAGADVERLADLVLQPRILSTN